MGKLFFRHEGHETHEFFYKDFFRHRRLYFLPSCHSCSSCLINNFGKMPRELAGDGLGRKFAAQAGGNPVRVGGVGSGGGEGGGEWAGPGGGGVGGNNKAPPGVPHPPPCADPGGGGDPGAGEERL